MKFILDDNNNGHVIHHYTQGEVTINGTTYRENLVLLPERVIPQWRPNDFTDLLREDFTLLAQLTPEIVILGTGAKQQFPAPSLTQPLIDTHIGLEVMDTAAACRTFNILTSEGRRVAAALIMIQ
ncbi:MAG: Mth938-like domain-containing protein [Candidatus Thiodiazotropha sp.]